MNTKIRYDNTIAENVRYFRLRTGLKQTEMVAKLQVEGISMSRDMYVKLEKGIRNISRMELMIIRQILQVTYDEIFNESINQKKTLKG